MYTYTYMYATIYIRKENEDTWNALKDKSGFINNALGAAGAYKEMPPVEKKALKEVVTTIIPSPTPINKESKDYSTCNHGNVRGFCKKGCK